MPCDGPLPGLHDELLRKRFARDEACYQPMTMLDSITLRARSRSEPVSCM